MDEAWAWALFFAIATLVSGGLISVAPSILERSPQRGWWCLILTPLPLVIWNIMWVIMSNPPDTMRRATSIVIGAIAGALILLAATELMKQPSNSQSLPLKPVNAPGSASPQVNVTGGGNVTSVDQRGGITSKSYSGPPIKDAEQK
jgi:hypothetical protein